MKKKRSGFTLIELLAVIVILGLLMAIAIPSVTKYITQSRKKTVVSTIGNYITAMVNEVNDLTYTFTGYNTIYAVPVECIALERGGTNPFGAWHQSNDGYWAYVLVQYDDETSSYTYGYTFKDSAGYGLYPTSQSKLNEGGKQIQTGLDLSMPQTGKVTSITDSNNWSGFKVDDTTDLVVLVAEGEGRIGDGKTTCTLQQKGNNYAQVEEEKIKNDKKLVTLIKRKYTIVTDTPTLTTSSNNTLDVSGLYQSSNTNSGTYTYYFRGNVKENYVKFANLKWKIIRINEDGTIRLILDDHVGKNINFVTGDSGYNYMYYSDDTELKNTMENWYEEKIINTGFDPYVTVGSFCEEARTKGNYSYNGGSANVVEFGKYTPTFKCSTDGNGKGIIKAKVGLISYDEVVFAGGYYNLSNTEYYLGDKRFTSFTMSPAGYYGSIGHVWGFAGPGFLGYYDVTSAQNARPVINLKSDVLAIGTGTSTDPYVIQTK